MNNNMIEFYDSTGKKMMVSKKDYLKKVLPSNIKQAWNNADELYNLIVMSLNDGFLKEMIKPAIRLMTIDTMTERSYTIMGIVYMKNSKLKKAEKILLKYCNDYKKTGVILTNLAKVYYEVGKEEKGFSILEESINLDPNQNNGLTWYLSLLNEKYGKDYINKIIEKLAQREEAWRPRLYHGSNKINQGKNIEGYSIFKSVIEDGYVNSESLKIISGELRKTELYEKAIELIEPQYNIEKHDIYVGLNMINIYYYSKKYKDALNIIEKLKKSNRVDIYNYLDEYQTKINQVFST